MKTRVRYECDSCHEIDTLEYEIGKPIPTSYVCKCGGRKRRMFGDIGTDKIDDSVSYGVQTMLYSSLPSGSDRIVL
jgi:hypothetical protein